MIQSAYQETKASLDKLHDVAEEYINGFMKYEEMLRDQFYSDLEDFRCTHNDPDNDESRLLDEAFSPPDYLSRLRSRLPLRCKLPAFKDHPSP